MTPEQKLQILNNADFKWMINVTLTEALKAFINEENPFGPSNTLAASYFEKRKNAASALQVTQQAEFDRAVNFILRNILEGGASQPEVDFTVNVEKVMVDVNETPSTVFDKIYGSVVDPSDEQVNYGKYPADTFCQYVPGVFDSYTKIRSIEAPENYEGDGSEKFWVLQNNDGISVWNTAQSAWVNAATDEFDKYFVKADAEYAKGLHGGNVVEVKPAYPRSWFVEGAKVFKDKLS